MAAKGQSNSVRWPSAGEATEGWAVPQRRRQRLDGGARQLDAEEVQGREARAAGQGRPATAGAQVRGSLRRRDAAMRFACFCIKCPFPGPGSPLKAWLPPPIKPDPSQQGRPGLSGTAPGGNWGAGPGGCVQHGTYSRRTRRRPCPRWDRVADSQGTLAVASGSAGLGGGRGGPH